ncbi:MAG: sigma-70 family RNA polymerase sigma factor [Solirubrobacteraceae bacterium]|nr:sigma-70 family RNA polymerase sigma factor [Solirubrobacteraceae bacterium]
MHDSVIVSPPDPVAASGAAVPSVQGAVEARLVRLAARGDDDAFTRLVRAHRAAIHAHAVRMLGDHAVADDVVQDVLCSAHRALRHGAPPVHVRAWLHEITRRTCIDHWRGTARRREVSYDAPDALAAGDRRRLSVSDDAVLAAARDREALGVLRQAFGDLSALQHDVLVQRELEGRSTGEIAERLGIAPTVVEGQISRGRRALTRAFRDLESGERCREARRLCDRSREHAIGVRDRRRLVPHLHRCPDCRRYAATVGADPALLDRGRLARAALLLPAPLLERIGALSFVAGASDATVTGGVLGLKAAIAAAVIAVGGTGALVATDVVTLPAVGGATETAPPSARPADHGRASTPATVARDHGVVAVTGPVVAVVATGAPDAPAAGAAPSTADDARAAAAVAGVDGRRPRPTSAATTQAAATAGPTPPAPGRATSPAPPPAGAPGAAIATLPRTPVGDGPLGRAVAAAVERVGDAVGRTTGAVAGVVAAAPRPQATAPRPGAARQAVRDVVAPARGAVEGTAARVAGIADRVGRAARDAGRAIGAAGRPDASGTASARPAGDDGATPGDVVAGDASSGDGVGDGAAIGSGDA